MAKVNMNQLMEDVVHINNQIQGLQMLLQNKKSIIAKYFSKSGNRRIDGDEVTAYQQERVKIEYDVERILKKLPKELTLQFVDKSYSILDWKSFTRFCKEKGISPNELRRYILVSSSVNQEKLNALYDRGKIDLNDLKGCYEATTTKSIALKFKNVEREIPIK